MRVLVLVMALMLLSNQASSEFRHYLDGNTLAENCGANSDFRRGFCDGYIIGVVDHMEGFRSSTDLGICLPPNVTIDQVRAVIVKYLDNHPEKLHLPAIGLVSPAVIEAFCRQ